MTVRSPLFAWPCTVLLVFLLVACGGGTTPGGSSSTGSSTGGSGIGTGSGTATLLWIPPTTNEDGTATSLNGFNIYTGLSQNSLQPVATVSASETSATVNNLPSGTVYFAVTALSSNGVESDFSNITSKTFN